MTESEILDQIAAKLVAGDPRSVTDIIAELAPRAHRERFIRRILSRWVSEGGIRLAAAERRAGKYL